jgi:hypothetical protein
MAETFPNTKVYRKDDTGPDVIKIQQRLKVFLENQTTSLLEYFPSGTILKNTFDSNVERTVIFFQKWVQQNIEPTFPATGEVGKQTWRYLWIDWLENPLDLEALKKNIIAPIRIISGKVIDKADSQPIRGVKVRMKLDPNNNLLTTTDQNGNFELQLTSNVIFYQGIFPTPSNYIPIENKSPTTIVAKPEPISSSAFEKIELDFVPNNFSGYYTDEPPNSSFEDNFPGALYNSNNKENNNEAYFVVDKFSNKREELLRNYSIKNPEKKLFIRFKEELPKYRFELWYGNVMGENNTVLIPASKALESRLYTENEFLEDKEGNVYRIAGTTKGQRNNLKSPPPASLPAGYEVGDIYIQFSTTNQSALTLRYVIDTNFTLRQLPTEIRNGERYVDRSNNGALHQQYKWYINKNNKEAILRKNLKKYVNSQADDVGFPLDSNIDSLLPSGEPNPLYQTKNKEQILDLVANKSLDLVINFMLQKDFREDYASLGGKKATNTRLGDIAKIKPIGDSDGLKIDNGSSVTPQELIEIQNYVAPSPPIPPKLTAYEDFIKNINEGNKPYDGGGTFSIDELVIPKREQTFANVQLNFISPSLKKVQESSEWSFLPTEIQKEIKLHTRITFTGENLATIPDNSEGAPEGALKQADYVLKFNNPIIKTPKGQTITDNFILPLNGDGSWLWNLGNIRMSTESVSSGLEEVKRKKYIINDFVGKDGDKTLEDSIIRKDLKNAILDTIDASVITLRSKIIQQLYDMLAEFGIKNPESVLSTIREFKQIVDQSALDFKGDPQPSDFPPPSYNPYTGDPNDNSTLGEFITGSLLGTVGNLEGRTDGFINEIKLTEDNLQSVVKELFSSNNPTTLKQIDKAIKELEENLSTIVKQTETDSFVFANPQVSLGTTTIDRETLISNLENKINDLKERKDAISSFKTDIGVQLKILTLRGIINFPAVCPKKGGILENIINTRNKLSKQINNIQKTLNTSFTTVDTFETIITAYQDSKIAILAAYAVLPLPLITATAGVVSTLQDAKDILLEKNDGAIDKIKAKINPVLEKLPFAIGILNQIQSIMSMLDYLIKDCAEKSGEKGTIQLTPLLIKSSEEETTENKNPPILEYKGFTFEIQEEVSSNKLKRRYAQALNASGNIALTGTPSYSSNEQILINELIFQIELNNLQPT